MVPPPALAGSGLDVKEWLSRPGVKLVAVEFYATWCKPCMEAVPKWKAVHDKYRAQGLRLVVVSVQEQGACASPDWAPDAVVCDEDGILQQQWKAGSLPQAFLWSWQGDMLVANGTVEQVEAEIETYFEQVPRILIQDPADERNRPLPDAEYVKKSVRAELARTAKFELVADEATREELRNLKKEGYGLHYEEKLACKLGQEVSPNSTLSITRRKTETSDKLILELFSVENGCLTGSSKVRVMNGDIDAAIAEAVTQLVQMLTGDVQLPGAPIKAGGTPEPEEPTTDAESEEEAAEPGGIVTPTVEEVPAPKERGLAGRNSEFFYVGLSFIEGILPTAHGVFRTNIACEAAGQLRFSRFRWEILSAGIGFEKPHVWNLGTAALFDIGGLFFRTGLDLLLNEGDSVLGIEAGAGYSFFLGRGWYIDVELDLTLFPGNNVALPIQARLGV